MKDKNSYQCEVNSEKGKTNKKIDQRGKVWKSGEEGEAKEHLEKINTFGAGDFLMGYNLIR